jgi:hypothetical protein
MEVLQVIIVRGESWWTSPPPFGAIPVRALAPFIWRSYTGVPGRKVSIVKGYVIGHSKQIIVYVRVTYSERFPR